MKWAGKELPEAVRQGQRLTTMTANQKQLVMPAAHEVPRCGESGATVGEWLPHLGAGRRRLCFIKSMHTDQINHAPAMTKFLTGHQLPGRPSIGAWASYGLGSENRNLPDFLVMISQDAAAERPAALRPLLGQRLSPVALSGREAAQRQDPVLYLRDPDGLPRDRSGGTCSTASRN